MLSLRSDRDVMDHRRPWPWWLVFENHCFRPLDKIPIILFCHHPIFMQVRCINFATECSQISSLIMDTLYIKNLIKSSFFSKAA